MFLVRAGSSDRSLGKRRRGGIGIAGAAGLVVAAVGCASQAPASGDEGAAIGETSEALTLPKSVCGQAPLASIDSIPAYRNDCGDNRIWSDDGKNTSKVNHSGWVATEEAPAGYQCVELAIRYEYFKYEVSNHWGIEVAADMCTHHPTNVSVISKTGTPVHGDLMVFPRGGHLGSAGHVAVVSSVSGSNVKVVQENVGTVAATTYPKSWASCFIHADRNNDCGHASNSSYCGATSAFSAGKEGTLYTCESHAVHAKTVCKYGCESVSGAPDKCSPAPSDAGDGGDDGGDVTIDDDGGDGDDTDGGDGVIVYDDDAGDDPSAATPAASSASAESGGCSAAPRSHEKDSRASWLVGLGLALLLVKRRQRG